MRAPLHTCISLQEPVHGDLRRETSDMNHGPRHVSRWYDLAINAVMLGRVRTGIKIQASSLSSPSSPLSSLLISRWPRPGNWQPLQVKSSATNRRSTPEP